MMSNFGWHRRIAPMVHSNSPSWWNARNRLTFLAATLWTILVVAACSRDFFPSARTGTYPIFANAVGDWLAGETVYSAHDTVKGYRYSPFFTSVLSVFGLCPDALGNALWRLLNAAVYLGGLVYWSRPALPAPLSRS